MKKFFNFLIESNFFISTCAIFIFWFYSIRLKSPIEHSTSLLVFFGTFFSYQILQNLPKSLNLKSYSIPRIITMAISLIFCCYGTINLSQFNLAMLFIACTVLGLYEVILLENFGLRKIPYAKPLAISFVWTVVSTYLGEKTNLYQSLDCFLFILFLSIPFDIKDLAFDESQNVKTLPMILKNKIYPFLGISYTVYCGISYNITGELFMLLSPVIYFLLLKYAKRHPNLYYLGFDGLIICRFLLYLFKY